MVEMDAGDYNNMRCSICEREYASRINFKKHMNSVHKGGKRKISALPRTKERINNSNPLMVEMDARNYDNKRCTICEKDYASRKSYRERKMKIHKDGKREPVAFLGKNTERIDHSVVPIWDDSNN